MPSFLSNARDLVRHIEPVPGKPLAFRIKGLGQEVSLIPFYKLHNERFSVYWHLYSQEGWTAHEAEVAAAEARRQQEEARMVDSVQPGEQQPETDHAWKGENTDAGDYMDRKWRQANSGGWFSYELKVPASGAAVLVCTYWGSDVGAREFDVLVDGKSVGTQKLNNSKPNEFFDVVYRLPEEATQGKTRVTVKFQPHPDNVAGGVFGCKILKAP